jgi:hypothetical protein
MTPTANITAIIAQQQFTIAHLEHYIASSEAMFYRS